MHTYPRPFQVYAALKRPICLSFITLLLVDITKRHL
jgi:hypothetical protein